MNDTPFLVARFASYFDFYFLDEGVLQVRVTSPLLWPLSTLAILLLTAYLIRGAGWLESGNTYAQGILGAGSLAIGYLIHRTVADLNRKKTARMTEADLFRSGKLFPWSEIYSVDRYDQNRLVVKTSRRTYKMVAPDGNLEKIVVLAKTHRQTLN